MSGSARVTSIESIARFQAALTDFGAGAGAALATLQLEVQRALEWIEHDRSRYWSEQARRAADAVSSARIALERCEAAVRPEDKRSCYEQKQALERARRRQRLCESKLEIVRRWRQTLRQEAQELLGKLSKLADVLEHDLPRAATRLDHRLTALEKYAELQRPRPAGTAPPEQPPGGDESP